MGKFRGSDKGAPPRTINVSLTFNELDIHDKKTIFEQELPPARRGKSGTTLNNLGGR